MLSLAIGSTLEAILILTSNIALLLLIITSPSMRRQMRYHLVLSVVCANLVAGLFSTPLMSNTGIHQRWPHDCYVAFMWISFGEYVQNFVNLWGLVLLLLHYMARVLKYEGPAWMVRLPSWLLKALPGLIVASPWIVAVVSQTPIVFTGQHRWINWNADECLFVLSTRTYFVLSTICYFIPAFILVILVIITVIIRFKESNAANSSHLHRAEMGATLVSAEKEEIESGKVHVVVAVVSVLLMGPHHMLHLFINVPLEAAVIGITVCMLLIDSLPFVLAIVWLLMLPEVKAR
ncbi:hypothetical protein ACOMHN_018618 [Nucella lapillus]